MNKELLEQYGIDYNTGLEQSMGDEDFYKMILSMFLKDTCYARAKEAYLGKDYTKLFDALHELRGVSGNAALIKLYNITAEFVENLRFKDGIDEEIDCLFAKFEAVYKKTCEGINLIIMEA